MLAAIADEPPLVTRRARRTRSPALSSLALALCGDVSLASSDRDRKLATRLWFWTGSHRWLESLASLRHLCQYGGSRRLLG
jgi:hypothetical protein